MTWALGAISYHDTILDTRGNLTVCGVFERAWHLSDSEGHVLTVAAVPYDGPMAIRVGRRSLVGLPIGLDMRGRMEGDCLVVGSVRIDLARASVWSPLALPAPSISPGTHLRDLSAVARLVDCRERQVKGPAWWQRAKESMLSLHDALVCSDVAAAREHCGSLLGLGPGLTPAGDDIVIGVLTALHVLGRRMRTMGPELAAEVGRGLAKEGDTAPLSRTLLGWAARGVAAQPLLDVLLTLGGDSTVSGVDALLAIGHSSGRDMLTGAHLAISAILAREEIGGPAMVAQT